MDQKEVSAAIGKGQAGLIYFYWESAILWGEYWLNKVVFWIGEKQGTDFVSHAIDHFCWFIVEVLRTNLLVVGVEKNQNLDWLGKLWLEISFTHLVDLNFKWFCREIPRSSWLENDEELELALAIRFYL